VCPCLLLVCPQLLAELGRSGFTSEKASRVALFSLLLPYVKEQLPSHIEDTVESYCFRNDSDIVITLCYSSISYTSGE
jgi:hypothetical protein